MVGRGGERLLSVALNWQVTLGGAGRAHGLCRVKGRRALGLSRCCWASVRCTGPVAPDRGKGNPNACPMTCSLHRPWAYPQATSTWCSPWYCPRAPTILVASPPPRPPAVGQPVLPQPAGLRLGQAQEPGGPLAVGAHTAQRCVGGLDTPAADPGGACVTSRDRSCLHAGFGALKSEGLLVTTLPIVISVGGDRRPQRHLCAHPGTVVILVRADAATRSPAPRPPPPPVQPHPPTHLPAGESPSRLPAIMMLTTDVALLHDTQYRKLVQVGEGGSRT